MKTSKAAPKAKSAKPAANSVKAEPAKPKKVEKSKLSAVERAMGREDEVVDEGPFKLSAESKRKVDERLIPESEIDALRKKLSAAMDEIDADENLEILRGPVAALDGAASNLKAAQEARAEQVRQELEAKEAEEKAVQKRARENKQP